MPYIIKRTDGSLVFENGLQENIIDADTLPVALIGKLTPDYGSYQSNNFIHLLENFASDSASEPKNAIKGMIWYNKSNNGLYVCVEEQPLTWQKISSVLLDIPDTAETGDFYYDDTKHKLSVYDEKLNNWIEIGPTSATLVQEGAYSATTNLNTEKSFVKIDIPNDTIINVELKIVAKEKLLESEKGLRYPECSAWIVKCCVSSYYSEYEGVMINKIDLIGNPSMERIASTSNAEDWFYEIIPNNNESSLRVYVNGKGIATSGVQEVDWTVYYHLVKV